MSYYIGGAKPIQSRPMWVSLGVSVISVQVRAELSQSYQCQRWVSRLSHIGPNSGSSVSIISVSTVNHASHSYRSRLDRFGAVINGIPYRIHLVGISWNMNHQRRTVWHLKTELMKTVYYRNSWFRRLNRFFNEHLKKDNGSSIDSFRKMSATSWLS